MPSTSRSKPRRLGYVIVRIREGSALFLTPDLGWSDWISEARVLQFYTTAHALVVKHGPGEVLEAWSNGSFQEMLKVPY